MRLSEISSILKENVGPLRVALNSADPGRNTLVTISHLNEYREAIDNIFKTKLFTDAITTLYKLPIFKNALPAFDLTSTENSIFGTQTSILIQVVEKLIIALDNAIPAKSDTEVAVKLPPFQTFDQFIEILKLLDKAFSQAVYNNTIDGSVIIDDLEPGSRWININLSSKAATPLIGALVWAGIAISNQMNNNALMEEELRAKRLQNDALEHVVAANKTQIDLLVQTEAELVYNESFKDDHEQIERLKLSIKSFAEIIRMGGEVHPALQAPASVKEKFPNQTPKLIESRTKKINPAPESKSKPKFENTLWKPGTPPPESLDDI